jgi:hypothetical protein
MNELFQKYLNGRLSRRRFVSGMSGLGLSMFTANTVAAELGPYSATGADDGADETPLSGRTMIKGRTNASY